MLALHDFESLARRHLPRMIYGFIAGAAETDAALRNSHAAFEDYGFVPRVLNDVSARSQVSSLLGSTYEAPFGIAPMGAAALCAYRGDAVLAAAAHASGIPMIVSGASMVAMEELHRYGTDWFQTYLTHDVLATEQLIDRVTAAGYGTLVLTADVPVRANRENNVRAGYSLPLQLSAQMALDLALHPSWLLGTFVRTWARHGLPHFENMEAVRGAPVLSRKAVRSQMGISERLTWSHLALIRRRWGGKLVVKGILSAADARLAGEHGVDGIIVSNHGGRQLDHAIPPLRVLSEIVAEAGRMEVMLDGGIRRGTDVLKALALGARFVFLGRPFIFAAAVAGEAGVAHAIKLLRAEIDRDMALLGIRALAELTPDHIRRLR